MANMKSCQEEMKKIESDLLDMGEMARKALERSVEALKKRDLTLAHQVVAQDTKINIRRFDIDNGCISLIETKQPVSGDLRLIISILNVVTELERIGDYAEGIAKIAIMIGDEPPLKPLIDIPRMAEIASEMTAKSVQALVTGNVEAATQTISMDNVVDNLYDQVFRELLTFMMVDPKTINRATRLIWVAHNLERAADRATNICERAVYLVTGKMDEIGGSKY